MESKPIFCVGMPKIRERVSQDVRNELQLKMNDYHVLVYETNSNEPVFNCFNGENVSDIQIEELKALIGCK